MRKQNSTFKTAFLSEAGSKLENNDYFAYVELDRYACYLSFYRKKMMDFQMGYQTIPALIYVMALGHRPGYPSWLYFDTLVANYQECGFDPALLGKAMERSGELIQLEKGVLYGYH